MNKEASRERRVGYKRENSGTDLRYFSGKIRSVNHRCIILIVLFVHHSAKSLHYRLFLVSSYTSSLDTIMRYKIVMPQNDYTRLHGEYLRMEILDDSKVIIIRGERVDI